MFPAVVSIGPKIDLHKGPPLGAHRLLNELHCGLSWGPIGLASIARNAGADDILPIGRAASITRHDMVQIEFRSVKGLPAILTGILVTLEDIVACELDLLLRKPIEHG